MAGSGPEIKTVDEILRQSGLAHFHLGGEDIVFDSVVLDSGAMAIENCVAGPNISIARLSDAARVDDAATFVQLCGLIPVQWQK